MASQGKPNEEIPPNPSVFEFVTFKASDVKDLRIDDPKPDRKPQPPQQPPFMDPAILGVSAAFIDVIASFVLRSFPIALALLCVMKHFTDVKRRSFAKLYRERINPMWMLPLPSF